MADPFNLAALKAKADSLVAIRDVPDWDDVHREIERAAYESATPDAVLDLHARLLAFRAWLVKERDEAALMGEQPAKLALDDALEQFDAAVRLEIPEGEQP